MICHQNRSQGNEPEEPNAKTFALPCQTNDAKQFNRALTCCNAFTALICGSAHEKYLRISITWGHKCEISQMLS